MKRDETQLLIILLAYITLSIHELGNVSSAQTRNAKPSHNNKIVRHGWLNVQGTVFLTVCYFMD